MEWEDRPMSDYEMALDDEARYLRYEAAQDEYDQRSDAVCEDCGFEWIMGWHPATRYDPAECDQPECPACNGEPKD